MDKKSILALKKDLLCLILSYLSFEEMKSLSHKSKNIRFISSLSKQMLDSIDFQFDQTISSGIDISLSLTNLGNSLIALGSFKCAVLLWDIKTRRCVKRLTGHTDKVHCITQLNNNRIASGSEDHTIKIWDITTGECTKTFHGHTDRVLCLIQLKDGRLASASSFVRSMNSIASCNFPSSFIISNALSFGILIFFRTIISDLQSCAILPKYSHLQILLFLILNEIF